jgi:hypothetical protein
MPKSRNRSRDIRKRAAKKRANKEKLQRKMDEAYLNATAKFQETFCSQCGNKFGPGDAGYSHCIDHVDRAKLED